MAQDLLARIKRLEELICNIQLPDPGLTDVLASEGLFRNTNMGLPDIEWGHTSNSNANANPLTRDSMVNFGGFARIRINGYDRWRDAFSGPGAHNMFEIKTPLNEIKADTQWQELNNENSFGTTASSSFPTRRPITAAWNAPVTVAADEKYLHIQMNSSFGFMEITTISNNPEPALGPGPDFVPWPNYWMAKSIVAFAQHLAGTFWIKSKTSYSSTSALPGTGDFDLIPFGFTLYDNPAGGGIIKMENKATGTWQNTTVFIDGYSNNQGGFFIVEDIFVTNV